MCNVWCMKVLGGGKHGKLGDLIIASVKDAVPRGKVKKGEVVNCVIVRAALQRARGDGSEIRFDKNAVVIVNKQGEPLGTRIFGPVPHELRSRNFMKILTLADHVTWIIMQPTCSPTRVLVDLVFLPLSVSFFYLTLVSMSANRLFECQSHVNFPICFTWHADLCILTLLDCSPVISDHQHGFEAIRSNSTWGFHVRY